MEATISTFPRILVLSPIPFNIEAGGGVTMSNLFRGWPKTELAQICSWSPSDRSVCDTTVLLRQRAPRRPHQVDLAIKGLAAAATLAGAAPATLLRQLVHLDEVVAWARDFRPDAIYARPIDHHPAYWWLPGVLAEALRVEYVVHIMDDWPGRLSHQPDLATRLIWVPLANRCLPELFRRSYVGIGISHEMCDALSARYQTRLVPFANCLDLDRWIDCQPSTGSSTPFDLVYLGAVTADKELASLQDIRDAVLRINTTGRPVRLRIFSAPQWADLIRSELESLPVVRYGGFVAQDELPHLLTNADLLVLPINFDEKSTAYVGTSLQTKVPEYMASGAPTLLYGPASSPNVRYARTEGWGYVVDSRSVTRVENAILTLMEDSELRLRLSTRARHLAFQNHDARRVRSSFRALLCDAAAASQGLQS